MLTSLHTGAFSIALKEALMTKKTFPARSWSSTHKIPPKALDIPFPLAQLHEKVIPFTAGWDLWHDEYCRSLCNPDFFCTGRWVGYYNQLRRHYRLDNPMVNIFLSSHISGDVQKVIGQGRDGIGLFSIIGKVLEDGFSFSLLKMYTTHSWEWRARMTPFGIYGTWHYEGSLRSEGAFWLWKEEWVPGEA